MGLADRDYMRENYRRNRGLTWNDRRSRVELDPQIQHRLSHPAVRSGWRIYEVVGLGLVVGAIGGLILSLVSMRRSALVPFPQSGSVTVSQDFVPSKSMSQLDVKAGTHDAVLQLFDLHTRAHVMSIYMGARQERILPIPTGQYSLRIAYGTGWLGYSKFFGSETRYELVRRPFEFSSTTGHVISLEQNGGNLAAERQMFAKHDTLR